MALREWFEQHQEVRGWLVVVGGFLVHLSLGTIYTIGMFILLMLGVGVEEKWFMYCAMSVNVFSSFFFSARLFPRTTVKPPIFTTSLC